MSKTSHLLTLTLKQKLLLLLVFIGLSIFIVSFVGLSTLRVSSEQDNEARIGQLFKSTYNVIIQLEQMVATGQLTEDSAKSIAAQVLRENKYHPSEYVYVTDENLTFVAAPHDPQLHGTSFNDFKDAQGRSIGQQVEAATRVNPDEMVSYDWTSERNGEVVNLTSVAQRSPAWGWYVGTGISYKEVNERYWDTAQWLLFIALVILGILTLVFIMFSNNLYRTLGGEPNKVKEFVHQVTQGNLSRQEVLVASDDESILASMIKMQSALRGIINSIKQMTHSLNNEIDQSDNRASDLDTLAQSLNEETASIATTMTQVASSAQSVSDSAQSAATATSEAEKQSLDAKDLLTTAMNTIAQLENKVEDAGLCIENLDGEVANIENVLTVIQGIAEQTNLLALNAAIEAARAGDQGRGFAVVADEVRQLAQRTQSSTEEIKVMISNLQQGTKDAVAAVRSSMETSEQTVRTSRSVSGALEDIVQSISTITEMNHHIAIASKQQLVAGGDSASRINRISQTARETAGLAVTAHKTTAQIKHYSGELEKEIASFVV